MVKHLVHLRQRVSGAYNFIDLCGPAALLPKCIRDAHATTLPTIRHMLKIGQTHVCRL